MGTIGGDRGGSLWMVVDVGGGDDGGDDGGTEDVEETVYIANGGSSIRCSSVIAVSEYDEGSTGVVDEAALRRLKCSRTG